VRLARIAASALLACVLLSPAFADGYYGGGAAPAPFDGGPITGALKLPDGTLGAPALEFTNDVQTGLFRLGSGVVAGVSSGTQVWQWGPSGIDLTGGLNVTQGPSTSANGVFVNMDATATGRGVQINQGNSYGILVSGLASTAFAPIRVLHTSTAGASGISVTLDTSSTGYGIAVNGSGHTNSAVGFLADTAGTYPTFRGSLAAGANTTAFQATAATGLVGGSMFEAVGGTQTVSVPLFNGTQTWNNSAVTFEGITTDTTNTASSAASKLLNLKVAGASKFAVYPNGGVTLGNPVSGNMGAGTINVQGGGFYVDGTAVSGGGGGSVAGCSVYRSTNLSVPAQTAVLIGWDSETRKDVTGFHSNVTNPSRLTADVSGWYQVSYQIAINARTGSSNNLFQSFLEVNGAAIGFGQKLLTNANADSSGSCPIYSVSCQVYLTAGDYLELGVHSGDATVTTTLSGGTVNACNFTFTRIN
jgi:hypothetical protein